MKLIFLDFDGVLHPLPNQIPNTWNEIKNDITLLDSSKVSLLLELCLNLKARIVVSSSWRLSFSIDQMNEIFNGFITGKTPELFFSLAEHRKGGTREKEVLSYLSSCKFAGSDTKWVAIDDQPHLYSSRSNIIITNPNIGLTKDHCLTIKTML